jgi:hypothetical protein
MLSNSADWAHERGPSVASGSTTLFTPSAPNVYLELVFRKVNLFFKPLIFL